MAGAAAENEAQETLAFGEWELNQQQLEEASEGSGAELGTALGLGAAGSFEELWLLQPVPGHRLRLQWHVTGGCTSWCTGFVVVKGDGLAREDAFSRTQPFAVSPFCHALSPFQNLVTTKR